LKVSAIFSTGTTALEGVAALVMVGMCRGRGGRRNPSKGERERSESCLVRTKEKRKRRERLKNGGLYIGKKWVSPTPLAWIEL
jgi:hypothetical protein